MAKENFEYAPSHDLTNPITDWMVYGGLKFPRYLITKESFDIREEKYTNLLNKNAAILIEGVPNGDAGDAHGQFHNELAWRLEQEVVGNAHLAKDVGGNLNRSTVVESLNKVRQDLESLHIDFNQHPLLTSKVTLQYGNDKEDTEEILLVPPLDGRTQSNWVSIESDLGKALENKSKGDTVEFQVQNQKVSVKILKIE